MENQRRRDDMDFLHQQLEAGDLDGPPSVRVERNVGLVTNRNAPNWARRQQAVRHHALEFEEGAPDDVPYIYLNTIVPEDVCEKLLGNTDAPASLVDNNFGRTIVSWIIHDAFKDGVVPHGRRLVIHPPVWAQDDPDQVYVTSTLAYRGSKRTVSNELARVAFVNKLPISKEAIEALPKKQLDEDDFDGESKIECSICIDQKQCGDEVTVLPVCSHWFDTECIQEWLAASRDCPKCRVNVE